jgi:CheY-like chemotaxis protein
MGGIEMSRPKILLVDDNRHFLELEKAFLKQCAVMIYTATTGVEALDLVALFRPDLIFLDLYMPEMDGAECCRILKSDPDLRTIPIVMITAGGKLEEKELCVSCGCDGFLVKPVDRRTFLACGHRFLPAIDQIELRVPCSVQVMYRIGERADYGNGVNLSTKGMFIASEREVEVDDLVNLSFFVPGERGGVVEAAGRVAWLNNGLKPALPGGFGVEFLRTSDISTNIIRAFMEDNSHHPEHVVEDAYVAGSLF